jgi:anti-sigma regulatory factor (Ser/Thr protein kinase)
MSDLAPGGGPQAVHSVAFYGSTAEFLTCVRAFVDQGLGGAEPVLVAVPDPSIGVLREHLDGYVDRVSWTDMTRIGGNPARIIPAIRAFAGTYPGHRVRCIAQPLWEARTAAQRRETVRHEALINLAFTDIPVSILCPYDVTRADGSIAASASLTHPMLIRDGTAQPSPGYDATAPLPAECDGPLDAVPGHAAVLAYRDDLRRVRAFVTEHASSAGAAPRRVGDLVLAVGELTANTHRHTSSGGTVSIWATGDELIGQVQDSGHISDPLAGRRIPAPDQGGGQGIWLVHQLCDLVEVRTGPTGTVIRLSMQLQPGGGSGLSHLEGRAGNHALAGHRGC